jgi:hypothetical protein
MLHLYLHLPDGTKVELEIDPLPVNAPGEESKFLDETRKALSKADNIELLCKPDNINNIGRKLILWGEVIKNSYITAINK